MNFDLIFTYEEAFVELCKLGRQCIDEALELTERDLGRSMSSKERENFINLGACFFVLGVIDSFFNKGDK